MILLSQWYEPEDPARLAELKQAREANEASGLFKEVATLDGSGAPLTYNDFFDHAAKHFHGEVCVLANSDIAFDASAAVIPDICRSGRLIALTRWEDQASPNMLGHSLGPEGAIGLGLFFSGTQDSWCFIAGGLPPLPGRVPMGVPGCDNVIAGWAAKVGLEVLDPALEVKTWHIHKSVVRRYHGCMNGFFGYPELTTLSTKGIVAGHMWPQEGDFQQWEWELISTCRR
jgi:hypothetical protein